MLSLLRGVQTHLGYDWLLWRAGNTNNMSTNSKSKDEDQTVRIFKELADTLDGLFIPDDSSHGAARGGVSLLPPTMTTCGRGSCTQFYSRRKKYASAGKKMEVGDAEQQHLVSSHLLATAPSDDV